MFDLQDTIVAPATPPGSGAIGVIRLSGKDAIDITAGFFKGKNLKKQATHTAHFGSIVDGNELIDEVLITLFIGPKSYTGENTVEISCHGSDYILQRVLQLCQKHGARFAKPGEFTLRAFLNGRLDLTQAEAVADLIAGHNKRAHDAAMHNLRGGFAEDLKAMREQLLQFSALIELELDFAEEDVEFADRTKFHQFIDSLTVTTHSLLQSFHLGNVIKNGVKVAIVGKPNAGKSTLLNALLNEERAIVSEIAGTTRDTIEETLNIDGIVFRLIDTAGIREHTTDVIEQKGMERSREAIDKADIVVYLFDINEARKDFIALKAKHRSKPTTEEDDNHELRALMQQHANEVTQFKNELAAKDFKSIIVGNKMDEVGSESAKELFGQHDNEVLFISARDRDNIQRLRERLYYLAVGEAPRSEGTIVTNARHHAALKDVADALKDIKSGLDTHLSGDLLSLDIRRCLQALGEITGEITTEDKLDYIFSKFCIGK